MIPSSSLPHFSAKSHLSLSLYIYIYIYIYIYLPAGAGGSSNQNQINNIATSYKYLR
jgi:hypothetical protein